MKQFSILIFLFIPIITFGQVTFQGVDITSFDPPEEWTKTTLDSGKDVWYKSGGIGYFEIAILQNNSKIKAYTFKRERGTALVLKRTYDELVKLFGKEDINNDYIPGYAEDDPDMIATAITIGEAEIYRGWDEDEHRAFLSWTESEFIVDISKK